MKKKSKHIPTLHRPEKYQIKVPGELDRSWTEVPGIMILRIEKMADGYPVTRLSCEVDQAALQGLLRQLYALGLPLISVNWTASGSDERS
jgi:hypothetical protein